MKDCQPVGRCMGTEIRSLNCAHYVDAPMTLTPFEYILLCGSGLSFCYCTSASLYSTLYSDSLWMLQSNYQLPIIIILLFFFWGGGVSINSTERLHIFSTLIVFVSHQSHTLQCPRWYTCHISPTVTLAQHWTNIGWTSRVSLKIYEAISRCPGVVEWSMYYWDRLLFYIIYFNMTSKTLQCKFRYAQRYVYLKSNTIMSKSYI